LTFPALPVQEDSNQDELLEIRRDLISSFRNSRFAEDTSQSRPRIVRYSDRYTKPAAQGNGIEWDYRLFPAELHSSTVKTKKKKKVAHKTPVAGAGDVLSSLPADDTEEKSGDEEEGEGDEDEVAEANEEDIGEEETDYALSYFDNGEDYLEPENDNDGDDGPTYS
jgi:hypothetical protein